MWVMDDVTAFVLAGGKSSRMGTDKAFLEFRGKLLLERAIEIASAVGRVQIVGDPEKLGAYGPIVADVFPGQGPLAGIHAALRSSRSELNLMLAVDMPFVRTEFLRTLVRRAGESDKLVTVPRADGRLQPLCAVYRRGFADIAEPALRQARNKIDPLFTAESTCVVDERELLELAFSPAMFDNLNTAEEFEKARSAVREHR